MIKKDFVKIYMEQNSIDDEKVAKEEIERFLKTFKYALTVDNALIFRNVGSFEVKQTKAREILDLKDYSSKIQTKPRKYVKFKISENFSDKLFYKD